MQTYISILRGINVSGHKKISMTDLRALYESLGFKEIKTYIQSGNVIFCYRNADVKDLAKKIEEKIKESYGFEVPVIVLTQKELSDTLVNNPFLREKGIDPDKLHVTFLSEVPERPNLEKIKDLDFGPDRYMISKREVYVYCPDGYGRTKIHNNFFENKLKVTATTRNWKTVNELARMAASDR